MKPILFQCGFFTVYTYGVFVALAFFVTSWLLTQDARRRGLDEGLIYHLCVLFLISGIVSARFFYVLLNWEAFRHHVLEIFMLQHGGLVWFGGFLGAVAAGLAYLRYRHIPILSMLDLFIPYVALGQAIGRIGCFFNGCCYGRSSAWGLYFPSHQMTLFPTQLIDALTLLIVFILLKSLCRKKREGEVFALYLILAASQRFLLEFLRGDERPFYGYLSIFQWMSLGLLTAGFVLFLFLAWKKKSVR